MQNEAHDCVKPTEGKHVWESLDENGRQAVPAFCEQYREFLSVAKTERETVDTLVSFARVRGFSPLEERDQLKPGDRVFMVNRNKAVAMAVIGSELLEKGLNIVGSHVDVPRLDLKPRPLYEESGLALLKTHYYGGIKKYQWVAIPLALHGVVVKGDGQMISLVIGEKVSDPVFTIADLLPHLAKDQMEKKMSEAVSGEALNILVGGNPVVGQEAKERVKQAVLDHLAGNYGIVEEDFVSAELEAVPAWPAREVGFDRSMIGGYGQDDRVSVFTSLQAIVELENVQRTAIALFVDKEEIGSAGNTGMQSAFMVNFIAELTGHCLPQYSELVLRRVLANSRAISADVTAGTNPGYTDVMDKLNAPLLGRGLVISKYTGSGGKRGASDASAEFVSFVRQLFNKEGVVWQTGELGKVDQGGGGTIAYLMAEHGMDVLDCGVPLLGMHSPFEVASKGDVYMAYKGYKVFLGS
ncbi:MAG TPA: aminopeptidase [Desulfotomaculum sp.]|jgi:aspartyl aminopeptidase|nr:aminopeptidase [Desulfotomaculum sp.]